MQDQILAGKLCPYCSQKTHLVDSSVVYKCSFGAIYICFDCDAYVGCHKGTTIAKGSLANLKLRQLRKQAHQVFDPLWKAKMKRDNCSKTKARNAGYDWLSQQLRIPRCHTHIAMFDEQQCQQVIELCSVYYQTKKS